MESGTEYPLTFFNQLFTVRVDGVEEKHNIFLLKDGKLIYWMLYYKKRVGAKKHPRVYDHKRKRFLNEKDNVKLLQYVYDKHRSIIKSKLALQL